MILKISFTTHFNEEFYKIFYRRRWQFLFVGNTVDFLSFFCDWFYEAVTLSLHYIV